MKTKEITELQRNNKTAMLAHFISFMVMIFLIFIQAAAGEVTFAYAGILFTVGVIPILMEIFFWSRNRETVMVKHLAAVGFALFYTIRLFTASNCMVFVFVIPMIFVVSVFNDIRYQLMINTGTIIESVIVAAFGISSGKFGYQGRETAIIQVVVMVMVAAYSVITTKTLKDNTKQRIEDITQSQQKMEHLLQANSELSGKLSEGIADISIKMDSLSAASGLTRHAMEEVSAGAADTAEHVQKQMVQTQAIQGKVDQVSGAVRRMKASMKHTLDVLEEGSRNVTSLVAEADESVNNGMAVTVKLEALNHYMEEMNTIVELIGGITSQTSLLALNASIEAARAGEAGRGFSVVAVEISDMAARTKEATANITALISNVSSAIGEVVGVISKMVTGINEEKQGVSEAAESFKTIQDNTFTVQSDMEALADVVGELKDSNQMIVDSVQTVSAISQEVSAHAGDTMSGEEKNMAVMNEIVHIMQELVTLAG